MDNLIKTLYDEFRQFRSENNGKLDTLTETVVDVQKNVALQGKDIEFIKKEDAHQNQILSNQQKQIDEHIQGTIQVREQNNMRYKEIIERLTDDKKLRDKQIELLKTKNKELSNKINTLERPRQWVKMTLWVFTSVGVVTGAIWGMVKLWQELSAQGLL